MINSRKFPQAHNHDAMRKFSSLLVGVHWGLLNAVISVWHSSRDAIKTELPYEPRAAAPKQLCRVRTEMRTTAIHSPSIWKQRDFDDGRRRLFSPFIWNAQNAGYWVLVVNVGPPTFVQFLSTVHILPYICPFTVPFLSYFCLLTCFWLTFVSVCPNLVQYLSIYAQYCPNYVLFRNPF